MSKEQVLELISAWSAKVRQALVLRTVSADYTALGFATCVASLAQEAGVEYPDDVRDLLKQWGVL